MSVGVIGHLPNPTAAEAAGLARAAEAHRADWLGLADAFWWRDVWLLLAEAARATTTLGLGPGMTNPYLRHPFHTVSALATLQELAGDRVIVGIAAGGSEVSGAAATSRRDAPARVADLVATIRRVAAGGPLDPVSGKPLELDLAPLPVIVVGRGDAMLRTAGEVADRVLVWSVPDSDLERTVAVIEQGVARRRGGGRPELVWAPLVVLDPDDRAHVGRVAVYAALNGAAHLRRSWGLSPAAVATIRAALVRGDVDEAMARVPDAALADLVHPDPDPAAMARRGRALGLTGVAVPGFDATSLPARLAWAHALAAALA